MNHSIVINCPFYQNKKQCGIICEAPDKKKVLLCFQNNIACREWMKQYCGNSNRPHDYEKCPYYRITQRAYDEEE